MDLGGRYAGTVSGGMNMVGAIAGGLSPLVVGYLVSSAGENWVLTFYITAAVYMAGAICWLFIDSATPVVEVDRAAVG
jgi:MFS family permease